jgi:hypothetical protein
MESKFQISLARPYWISSYLPQPTGSCRAKFLNKSLRPLRGTPGASILISVCNQGAVLDVAVDLRGGSATFDRHVSVVLSAEN